MAKPGRSGIDVYETNPLPESDQQIANDGTVNPFGQLPEYELSKDTKNEKNETLNEKLQKLWIEVNSLQEDLSKNKEAEKLDEQTFEMLSGKDLFKQLDVLKKVIDQQKLEAFKVNLTDPQGSTQKKLLNEIDKFTSVKGPRASSSSPSSTSSSASSKQLSYHMVVNPSDQKMENMKRLALLEERISRLNKVVGSVPCIPPPLMYEAANNCILDIISNLVSKSKSLECQNWMDVESKAGAVLRRLDQIEEKKDIMEQKAKMDKISELYNIMLKWNQLSIVLPSVVDRLTTLKQLHQQALEFQQVLGHLEVTQQQINVQLKGHSELLKTVQEEFRKNSIAIKTNCENLEKKLKALEDKK
ncbi:hypothetical protein HELRODRAFT_192214 [Helobdella robusta]|uniref:Dynactin subunit 2 n=1 Tax=Helobdella robusta TaxID=6412 RepID=T1FTP8_HELRO|nr:hypothetical protein HELRODRAFT_192214 [Helobdella robusta]ESO01628.1 hypothetical protein HELRODRAFT_192214 [Helobdella robusta]